MDYSIVVDVFNEMEATSKRTELTDLIVRLLKSTPKELIDKVVYLMLGRLKPEYEGIELGIADKMALRALSISSGIDMKKVEEMYVRRGDIGEAAEEALSKRLQSVLFKDRLTVERVYSTLEKVAMLKGEGSQDVKIRYLCNLLNDAEPREGKYILKMVTAKLRLGIADYTLLDALAIAFTESKENREVLERAYNLTSDLGLVARVLVYGGLDAVKAIRMELFRPIRPMLAERVSSAEEALGRMGGRCAAEYKLDGERLQIHKHDDTVKIFSRRLEDITNHYPDAVDAIAGIRRARDLIVEGEAVAINQDTQEYLPFQELMHRRRKYGIEEAMKEYPITLNLFDILYIDGKECIDLPYMERRRILEDLISDVESSNSSSMVSIVPMLMVSDAKSIEDYMFKAINEGCEGLMLKDLNSPYRAGARGYAWIKLKREYRSELADTLDLVVVGAFHGRGRRTGRYGALLLASYNREDDTFYTVCKVGTGFTDEDLERFHTMLSPYILKHRHVRVNSRLDADVWFEPKIVIEVIASEITLSPLHTCALNVIREGNGLALRFPKFTGRIRDDKNAEDATSVDEIVSMYRRQLKVTRQVQSNEGSADRIE
ncbi:MULTISPECIES: ATP-dependent DNA ligase [Candidatus Nitrosocaldus]|jgi:DNA ligase-1|uniref:DNA ligase n=1 Tax=Candidatus Nitrosocaldus cavascurensis TaxID=2058097 RepID=A0A2K5APM2_9ARCH|nr:MULTISPECIES: ATP-dependent DNA ligase [Candidatus Nitrosocaldus]SPC33592.1 DNA ligase [Candidatus Nitrosocaldus cavascurensis]